MKVLVFNNGSTSVAINPAEISEFVPMRDAGWTLITMKNRKEHAVQHTFADVLAQCQQVVKQT